MIIRSITTNGKHLSTVYEFLYSSVRSSLISSFLFLFFLYFSGVVDKTEKDKKHVTDKALVDGQECAE